MILVIVGTTPKPFDRLIRAMDRIGEELNEQVEIQTGASNFKVKNAMTKDFYTIEELEAKIAQARIIVSHAGVGTIIDARRHRKPIVVLPRRKDLGEMWDNHQLDTIRELRGVKGVFVAEDETRLRDRIMEAMRFKWENDSIPTEKEMLVKYVKQIIDGIE